MNCKTSRQTLKSADPESTEVHVAPLGPPSRIHLQTTEVEQCLVTQEMISVTLKTRSDTLSLQHHDMVFQGTEYVVADATRLIDIAGGNLQTAEEVEAEKFIEQIDSQ